MKIRQAITHLLFASTTVAVFALLAPWNWITPPPEAPRPQRLIYPTFHLRPHEDPRRNSLYNPVLQASRPIDAAMVSLPSDVGLYLVPGEPVPWNAQYMGRKVRLYNNTNETKAIPTSDYALFVIPEAKGIDGRWRALENYMDGNCDFSYFTVNLEPRRFWEFTVPFYEGTLQTRMRYALSLGGDSVAYSEEFDGSVAPELLGRAWGVDAPRPAPRVVWAMPGDTQPL